MLAILLGGPASCVMVIVQKATPIFEVASFLNVESLDEVSPDTPHVHTRYELATTLTVPNTGAKILIYAFPVGERYEAIGQG